MDQKREIHKDRRRLVFLAVLLICIVIAGVAFFYCKYQSTNSSHRQQEPVEPFPYAAKEVHFRNDPADITLAGTLTLPRGNGQYPVVVLISGYGPQNRDAEWAGHKPFLVIADHLTRLGIAVLRFDDRGFGKSTGNYHSSTSLDFATDVESAIKFLRSRNDIDITNIGLIGHSDGAMVAPLVAMRSKDVRFIVMLAAPGILGAELMVKRQELIERKLGKSESDILKARKYMETLTDIIVKAENESAMRNELQKFAAETKDQIPDDQIPPGLTKDEFISQQISMLTSPWFKYFFSYDPRPTLEKIKCPVLAITGDKDVQAPPEQNLQAIENALRTGGNSNITIKTLPGLNHMFQECNTGMVDEYAKIDQTFSPTALLEISSWILGNFKKF